MEREVGRGPKRARRVAGERRRADRETLASNQLFGIGTVRPCRDKPDSDVELVALEIGVVVARDDPYVGLGVQAVEPRQSPPKPKRCERGGSGNLQRSPGPGKTIRNRVKLCQRL